MEFYLVAPNTDPAREIEPPMGRSGRRAAARQAYSMSAVDEYGPIIDDIYDFAEAQGLEIDGILHEGGAGQIELNLRHGAPGEAGRRDLLLQTDDPGGRAAHNCFATFMAKPIEGEPGRRCISTIRSSRPKTGRTSFPPKTAAKRGLPAFHRRHAAHLPSVIALLAPYVNSYRRYVRDFAAPINLEWGRDNRTTGLRVPVSDAASRRVENRLPGMDCNPYLGIAASLACGYLGLVKQIDPQDPSPATPMPGRRHPQGARQPRWSSSVPTPPSPTRSGRSSAASTRR
jgi:glutamine synthetase